MQTLSRLLTLFIVASFASACGDDGVKGKLTLQMQAVSSAALAAQGAALTLARDETECSAIYKASNSQSGAADSIKVFVKKIVIDDYDADTGSGGAPITIFESSDSGGAELELSSGKVDLSELLDYDAGLTALEPEAGGAELEEGIEGVVAEVEPKTYRRIQMTLANRALVKGCISTDWAGDEGPNAATCADGAAAADLCDPLTTGIHTFCTQSAYDSTTVFADDANIPTSAYEGVSAQEVEVPLEWLNDTAGDLTAEVTYYFNTPDTVVDEENQPTLTLALDLNTMLSFEANTRTEGTNSFNSGADMSGGAKYDKAFFYTSRINNQMMAFLGDVGDIHGYKVDSCYFFNEDTSDARAVKSWMTVIFDADGNVATGLVTPTDAAGFVLLKGDIHAATKESDGTFDLDICGGYDVTPGGTCSQLNNYLPLESVDQTASLPKEDMIPNGDSAGTWEYTRKL